MGRLIGLAATVMLALALAMPSTAQAAMLFNRVVPFSATITNPCFGEFVLLSGRLHVMSWLTTDANGGRHARAHAQPMGITGVGMTTGAQYQGTGVTSVRTNDAVGPHTEFTFINNFKIIGHGKAPNLLIHQTVHVTINANGDMTAEVDNSSSECR